MPCSVPRHQQQRTRLDRADRHLADVNLSADAVLSRGAFDGREIGRGAEQEVQIAALIILQSNAPSKACVGVDSSNTSISSKTSESICGVEKSFFIAKVLHRKLPPKLCR